MNIVYNETFSYQGNGLFRVLVATNVVAKIFAGEDEVFDVVYYFGQVTDDENLEAALYEPNAKGNADIAASRVSLSLEETLRIQTGETFRQRRECEQDFEDYPLSGANAVYFKRTEQAFWAFQVDTRDQAPNAVGDCTFYEQNERDGVMTVRSYGWDTLEQMVAQMRLFGYFGPTDAASEIGIADYPGLRGMTSCAYG